MLNLKELLNPATPPRKPSPSPPPAAPIPIHPSSYPGPQLLNHNASPPPPTSALPSYTSSYLPPKQKRESISLDQLIDRPTPTSAPSRDEHRVHTPLSSHSAREDSHGSAKSAKRKSAPRPAGKTLPALKHLSTQSRRPTESPSGSDRSRSSTPERRERDREETVTDDGHSMEVPVKVETPAPAPTKKRKAQPSKKKAESGVDGVEKKKKAVGDGAPKKKKGIATVQKKKKAKLTAEPTLPTLPASRPEGNGHHSNGSYGNSVGDRKDSHMTGVDSHIPDVSLLPSHFTTMAKTENKNKKTPKLTKPRPRGRKAQVQPRSDDVPSSEMDYDNGGGEVFCICRGPDNGRWMIGCDGCEDWFHGECVNIKESDGDQVDKYFCPTCHGDGKGTTSWKRVCRLPGCRRPAKTDANPPSKYCSVEHGKQYFTLLKVRAQTQAEKAVPPRQLAAILQKLAVSQSTNTAQDFKALGERIPTPPLVPRLKKNPALDTDGRFEPELLALEKASQRLKLAQARKVLVDKKLHFVKLATARAKTVVQENGKPACGYDKRLSLDDPSFSALADAEYPEVDDSELCTAGPNCNRHKTWQKKFLDEVANEERLIAEEVAGIKAEEKRVNEVLKLKVIGLEEGELEGWTEKEG